MWQDCTYCRLSITWLKFSFLLNIALVILLWQSVYYVYSSRNFYIDNFSTQGMSFLITCLETTKQDSNLLPLILASFLELMDHGIMNWDDLPSTFIERVNAQILVKVFSSPIQKLKLPLHIAHHKVPPPSNSLELLTHRLPRMSIAKQQLMGGHSTLPSLFWRTLSSTARQSLLWLKSKWQSQSCYTTSLIVKYVFPAPWTRNLSNSTSVSLGCEVASLKSNILYTWKDLG